jgi:membrane protease subunit (stomatin/prohibitin family)
MSELFEKLVESAGHVISEVDKGGQIQSAVTGLRQRLAETERRRRVNLLKQEIRELQTQEAQTINALSAQVLALHEAGTLTQPELVSLCRGVDEVRTQIKEKQSELKQYQPSGPAADAAQCPHCGSPVVEGAGFCQTCGGRIVEESAPPPVLYCVHCGSDLRDSAQFCPKCGQVVER